MVHNTPGLRVEHLKPGTPRSVRNRVTRAALLQAAARIVGEEGYAGATVARITRMAGVAQGTFYNHFPTRQALLEELLPALGQDLVDHIARQAQGIDDPLAREEQHFRAFFTFLHDRPEFYRVLHEAEHFAPAAYWTHHEKVQRGYVRWLRGLQDRGLLGAVYDEAELIATAQFLMGARDYIAMLYKQKDATAAAPVPEAVVRAYMRLLRGHLFRQR